jgi:hypothetical protein
MADVLQRALDPRVPPRRILLGHANNKPPDLEPHASPSGRSGVCPLPRNQLAMPAQQRVRRRDRSDLSQGRTADLVRPRGQSTAIVVRQSQSPVPELSTQEPVFFDQIRNRLPLSAVQPAGQHAQH